MFGGLVSQAQTAVNQTVNRVIGQAAVALPLLVASGFLTAAGLIELISLYGAVQACLIVAGVFLVISLITAVFATRALGDVEALVTGETTKEERDQLDAANPAPDLTKLITEDPLMAVSAATTGFGFIKSFSRRTQVTIVVAALLIGLAVLYFARRKPDAQSNDTTAEQPPTPAQQAMAAAA